MSPAYLLVLHSLLFSFILGIILLFYRFVYPKKEISLFILLILIALLPLMSMLRPGTYESGDLSIHIMEQISFYKFLNQGNFFPIWGGDMNATYGYPSFLFTYPLPFYLMAAFHFIGASFTNSAKLLLASSYLLSGIFMYLWLKKEIGAKGAFIGSLFYLFAPYHLIDLHFRADVGEILAFVFLPLTMLAAQKFVQTKATKWFVIEVVAIASLILSHPAISLSGLPVLLVYIFILIMNQRKKVKLFLLQSFAVLLGILLTSFYLLPVLYELRFTYNHQFSTNIIFLQLRDLLYSPWKFGFLFQGPQGQLSFLLGYVQLAIIVSAFIIARSKKIIKYEKSLLLISLFVTMGSIFMMLEIAKPIWGVIPFIKNFQFTYRLLGVTIFSISVLAAITVKYMKKDWIIVLVCFLVVFTSILNWGNRKNLPQVTDQVLSKQIPFTAFNGAGIGQAVTVWSDPNHSFAEHIPKHHIEIIQGEGTITEVNRTNTKHIYVINALTPLVMKENTLYFPGWNVFINQNFQKINILLTSIPRGLISFTVPKGLHKLEVVFHDTLAVSVGKAISTSVLLMLFLFIIFNKKIYHD